MKATLLETDWSEEWKALQTERRPPDSPAAWDARAAEFRPREAHRYAQDFMRLMNARPGESVLDMGCGAGSLAIPLAQAGHTVIAADFSQSMLDALMRGAATYRVEDSITPKLLAWDDEWSEQGISKKCVDIAIASRSIATRDLKTALLKLTACARCKCCITLVVGPSPHCDEHIMREIGIPVRPSGDYLYAVNILAGMGYKPELRYIVSPRQDTFDTVDELLNGFKRMLKSAEPDKEDALRAYVTEHTIPNPHAGEPGPKGKPQGRFMLDHIRATTWAFISWSPDGTVED